MTNKELAIIEEMILKVKANETYPSLAIKEISNRIDCTFLEAMDAYTLVLNLTK